MKKSLFVVAIAMLALAGFLMFNHQAPSHAGAQASARITPAKMATTAPASAKATSGCPYATSGCPYDCPYSTSAHAASAAGPSVNSTGMNAGTVRARVIPVVENMAPPASTKISMKKSGVYCPPCAKCPEGAAQGMGNRQTASK